MYKPLKSSPWKLFLYSLLLIGLPAAAQDKGIHFEHALSWQQVKAKAKAENKFIFADCYTTWCGPCKMMSRDVFPQEEVGAFLNDKFISVKVQMDKTAKDEESVKRWYKDAEAIGKEYNVMAYPTFLYFSPEGKLVHLVVGSDSAAGFIAASAKALQPETQYYTRMAAMAKSVVNHPDTLKKLATDAAKNYDGQYSRFFSCKYLQTVPDLFAPEVIRFMDEFTHSSQDTGFIIFRKNATKIDQVMSPRYAESKVQQIIMGEEIYAAGLNESTTPDFKAIQTRLQQKYPEVATLITEKFRLQWYQHSKSYDLFEQGVQAFMKQYAHQVDASELNSFARSLGRNTRDTAMIRQALEWSGHAVKEKPEPEFISTQAFLLYRLGDTAQAIRLQEEAISRIEDKKENKYQIEYQQRLLDKMRKGEEIR
ncbi:thioredoxin fold domain-containing protein [Chitinophaga sp. HK235]|uniref:thioredoxin family protein n=1 Tax=Chitinophaga sp. HK235 TaxID=2952571 RepID=UPI001BAD5FD0|nr:thioredoxin family protein [Chitinophaga sp. HK235]